jgi:TonB family protein
LTLSQDKKNDCRTTHKEWDVPPTILKSYQIKYPEDARKDSIQGTVWFKVEININGKVTHIEIAKKEGVTESMIMEAKTAIENYIFKPAMKNNREVAAIVTIPIRFKLK